MKHRKTPQFAVVFTDGQMDLITSGPIPTVIGPFQSGLAAKQHREWLIEFAGHQPQNVKVTRLWMPGEARQ